LLCIFCICRTISILYVYSQYHAVFLKLCINLQIYKVIINKFNNLYVIMNTLINFPLIKFLKESSTRIKYYVYIFIINIHYKWYSYKNWILILKALAVYWWFEWHVRNVHDSIYSSCFSHSIEHLKNHFVIYIYNFQCLLFWNKIYGEIYMQVYFFYSFFICQFLFLY